MILDAIAARSRLFHRIRQLGERREMGWEIPTTLSRRTRKAVRLHRQMQEHHVTTFTPTAFTFTTALAFTSYATATAPNATVNLDLSTKFGAWWFPMIGRNASTALTRSAYWGARRSFSSSSTIRLPQNNYDFVSSIALVNATTVSSGGAAAATTMTLGSGTGMAAQQTLCAQLAAARCEFFQICNVSAAVVTIDDANGFKVTHNASDVVTNGADCGAIWLPGGDLWYLQPVNNSGQTLIMGGFVEVYASDQGT